MNSQIQRRVNERIEGFVAEITELARKAAFETLSSALQGGGKISGETGAGGAPRLRPRRGGKRSPDEIAAAADVLLQYIRENPGQRMETIAAAMGSSTRELALPIKRLLQGRKIQVQGQKRATSYSAAPENAAGRGKGGRGVGRPRKKAG
jgi:hypothetical protein